ncbi:hypothetical protein HY995_04250 [Candidatus Micrarchaeota archaeon]|nr:hypothetical protein [Candidatus Micrarchaeota archaeon]MBI5177267.1 hypothetical protein [Candidatus Micrarchaeota archaeon]
MELTIESKSENKLFGRTEVAGRVETQGATVARPALREAIGRKLGVNADAVHVRIIEPSYGSHANKFVAEVYSSKEGLEKAVGPKRRMRETKKAKPGAA